MRTVETDVLVLGAGPAGLVASALLGRADPAEPTNDEPISAPTD